MKKHLKLENLIYLSIMALPSYLWRFSVLGFPTNVSELLIITVVAWWLIRIVLSKDRQIIFPDKEYLALIALLILGMFLSIIKNNNHPAGLGILKGWLVLPLAFSFVAYNVLDREKLVKAFLAYYLSCLLVAFLALGYLFLGQMTFDARLEAFFNSSNYLAMYLAPGIIIGMMLLVRNSDSKRKGGNLFLKSNVYSYGALTVLMIAMFFTYSYASWAATAASFLAVLSMDGRVCRKHVAIFLLIMVATFYLVKDTAKFNDLIRLNGRSSLASRTMIWQSAEKILKDNLVFGIGPANFQEKYLQYQKFFPPYLEWAVPHPHSLYLAFWLYAGIVGFFSFVLLLFFWLKDVLKKKKDALVLMALGVMIYIILHGFVDTTYFKNDLSFVFWMSLFSGLSRKNHL